MNSCNKRREQIAAFVNKEGFASIQRIREAFPSVSDVTLRKDLSYLDSTMRLIRMHGGAKSLPEAIGQLDNHGTRLAKNVESKKIIAAKACTLLQENQSVFIAAGTTCIEFVKALPPNLKLQFFTDGLATAMELSKCSDREITVFGGELDCTLMRISGTKVLSELSNLRFDYAFFSANGYRQEYGFVCQHPYFYSLLQTMREHTEKMVILMDSSKINSIRSARIFSPSKVDIVVGDDQYDAATINSLKKYNVTVL